MFTNRGIDMSEIRKVLLRKLLRAGKIGASHTSFDNLPKGFPKHLSGEVKEEAEKLIKENLLIKKPTNYGLQAALNPARIKEIKEIAGYEG